MFKILGLNKNFRSLWSGQLISALGDRLTQMGILTFLVVTGEDKGDKVALITFFSLLPFLLFGPLFGALVDRVSRKRLMIAADVLRAVLVVFIPALWIGTHSVPVMVFWFFVLGSLTALFSPAKMSIITNITDKDTLLEANSLIVTTGMVATLIGTLVAGAVIKATGVQPAFYINGLTYLVSAVFILGIVYKKQEAAAVSAGSAYKALLTDLKAGLRYVRGHGVITRLIFLSSTFSFISSFAYIAVLNYGATVLRQDSLGIGLLLSAAGIGMIAGSLALIRKKDTVNYAGVLSLSFGTVGISCLLFLARPGLLWSLALLFLAGTGAAVISIALDTIFQRITPDDLKGKIFAARGVVTNSVFLVSLLVVGLLVRWFDAGVVFALAGIVGTGVALGVILSERLWGYKLLRLVFKLILKAGFGFTVSGLENLPKTRRLIFAGNHTSILDGLILMAATPGRIYFLAADSLFQTHPWGWMARRLGYIPIKRGGFNKESIRDAVGTIKSGASIGIFPEGHITADGRLSEGREGVALIARLSGAAVVPFAIEGAYEAWPVPAKYPKRFPISIHFSAPIDVKEYPVREALTEEVMQEISRAKLHLEREGYLKVDPDEIIKHLINIG